MTWPKPLKSERLCYHNSLLHNSDQQLELLSLGTNRETTHIHIHKYCSTALSDFHPPHSEALSAVQFLNKWAQPCMYWGTPSEEFCVLSVSMWPLFCSGAGMCGAEWYWTMGQLTVDMACWTNWIQPQRDQFPPAKCSAPPVSGNGGLDGLWDWQVDQFSAVMRSLYHSDLVKKELSRKAKLSIYQSIYVPTLPTGHEVWVMTSVQDQDRYNW